jgi:hypothetical protein
MSRWNWLRTRIGRGRLVFVSIVVALALPLVFLDWFRILRLIPRPFFWRSELVFLIGIEAAYGVTLVVTILAIPGLSSVCLAGRRRGQTPVWAARWLLCATSLFFGLLTAETVVFLGQNRGSRMPVLPGATDVPVTREHPSRRLPPPGETAGLREHFPDEAGDGVIDLVVVGESSAEGVPFQRWLSIGALVKWQLEKSISNLDVRLETLARAGDTLEQQHEALAGLRRRPEILIIYCGHNEFSSRFFALRDLPYYSLDERTGGWGRFVELAERLSPLCGLIRRSADQCRIALPPPPIERDLVDVPVFAPGEYSRILADFRRRLEEIVSYARNLGTLPILISPPGNDADFEPNRSFLPAGTPPVERESFQRAFLEARRLESADPVASLKKYRELLLWEPGFAETHYRLATLLRNAGEWDESYRHFISARDLDGYPMRCFTAFQEVYRAVASRHDCILIDGQSYFHAIGRNGLLDDELFQDAMHPSLRGQIALAQAVVRAIQERWALEWPAHSSAPVIDPSACAEHFGLGRDTWEHAARWSSGFYGLVGRLRYDSSERSRRIDAGALAADQIKAGVVPEAVGLPNVGVPAPVPLISGEGRSTVAKQPATRPRAPSRGAGFP